MSTLKEAERVEALLAQARRGLKENRVPAKIFNDPGLHQLEMERIFGRAWIFLAHESEIPNNGDFVLRKIAEDEFIVVRDDAGVQVLYNSCRHRGMRVAYVAKGNTKTFRCPYHGWVYRTNGALQGVPFENKIYGAGELEKSISGLLPAPKVDSWNGLIFASLNEKAPDLREYLGDMAFYLEFYTRKAEEGLEVIGEPHRWVVRANWKLGGANFIGDGYHTSTTHFSTVKIGVLAAGSADFLLDGVQVTADSGGLGFRRMPPGSGATRGYPPEVLRLFDPAQRQILESGCFPSHGTIFPNLSFLSGASIIEQGAPPVPYFTLRVWQPVSPEEIEVWSWFLIDKRLPDAFKRDSYASYVFSFGSSGVLEQDDTENWTSITSAARGQMARRQELNYAMGSTLLQPMSDWPGPGKAYSLDYTEAGERAFYEIWSRYMEEK